jgi:flagellar export protein FliJ
VAKFRFSLEMLLRHREHIEQRERDELLRLNYNQQVELQNREDLSTKFRETMNELSLKRNEAPSSPELNYYYLYLNRLTYEIGECEKRLLKLQSEIQAQKEVVIEASKKKKTLTTLKAKREKEFILAQEKQEQKEIDELVVTRYGTRESEYPPMPETLKIGRDLKQE